MENRLDIITRDELDEIRASDRRLFITMLQDSIHSVSHYSSSVSSAIGVPGDFGPSNDYLIRGFGAKLSDGGTKVSCGGGIGIQDGKAHQEIGGCDETDFIKDNFFYVIFSYGPEEGLFSESVEYGTIPVQDESGIVFPIAKTIESNGFRRIVQYCCGYIYALNIQDCE